MLVPDLADALLRVALFGSLFLVAAHVAAFLLRKSSAESRHLVWSAALLAAVVLPLATLIPARLAWLPPATSSPALPSQLAEIPLAAATTEGLPLDLPTSTAAFQQGDAIAGVGGAAPASHAALPAEPTPNPIPWPSIGAWLWALGTACLLIKLGLTALAARRAMGSAAPASDSQATRFRSLAERMEAPAATKLMVSNALGGPRTGGVFSPVVVAPADKQWHGSAEGEIALLHELGHVKRRDVATQFIGLLASALYWWNPLAWSAAKSQRKDAELACDDSVLLAGTNPEDYAGCLLAAARRFKDRPTALHLAMASPHGLERRIEAALDHERRRSPFSLGHRVCAWSTVTVMAICGGTLARAATPEAPAIEKPEAYVAPQGFKDVGELRKEVAADPGNPMIIKRLASALARNGENKEALELMLWCFDHGDEPPHESFHGVRLSFLLGDIEKLARTYPPAKVAMIERRDSAKKILLGQSPTTTATANFIRLNETLGDEAMTLAAYEQLVKNSNEATLGVKAQLQRSKERLFKEVVPFLIKSKRYDEVVDGFGDPIAWLEDKAKITKLLQGIRQGREDLAQHARDRTRDRHVTEAGYLYSGLLGAKKHDLVASKFAAGLIEFAPALGTWKTLIDSAESVGRAKVAETLRADAKKVLSEADFARLAFKRK